MMLQIFLYHVGGLLLVVLLLLPGMMINDSIDADKSQTIGAMPMLKSMEQNIGCHQGCEIILVVV